MTAVIYVFMVCLLILPAAHSVQCQVPGLYCIMALKEDGRKW